MGASKFDTTAINVAETIGAAKELTICGLYQISVGGAMNETVGGAKAEEVIGIKALVVANNMDEKIKGNRTEETFGHLIIKGDKIVIQADEAITTETGSAAIDMKSGGNITISGSNIQFLGEGSIGIKDSNVAYTGPAGAASSSLEFEKPKYDDKFQLIDFTTGKPLADYPYKLQTESGNVIEGRTDEKGFTAKIKSDKPEKVSIQTEVIE